MATGKQPFESHPEYMEIAHKQYTSRFMRAIQLVLVALVIHYLWWWVPLVALAWWLCGLGYGWYVAALVAVYLPFFFDRKHMRLGRPVHWFRRLPVWRLLQCYLSLRVIRMRRLDPTKKYVFATLPHGILVLSRTAFYGGDFEQLFPGVDFRCLGATPMFLTPAARELCMALGAVDASRASAERVLKAGKSLQVYPGGSKEIFPTNPASKDTVVVLTPRKGFVKLALKHGAQLVPVFVFGEKWMYHRLNVSKGVRQWFLRVLRVPLLIFWGRFCTWIPLPGRQLSVVFGAPIPTPHVPEPSEQLVNEVHAKFVAAVQEMFEQFRDKMQYDADERLVVL